MSYQFTTTTSHSDETYLESFLESLIGSSFPNEIRRTLEHLRYLNEVGDVTMEEWRGRQDDCLLEVKKGVVGLRQSLVGGDGDENGGRKRKREEGDATSKSEGHAKDSVMSSVEQDSEHRCGTDQPASENNDQFTPIPTNQEILTYLHKNHPQIFLQNNEISVLHDQLQQLSAERIQTAHQLRGMVDMALGRLNRDLDRFEKELGIVSTDAAGELASVAVASAMPTSAGRASSVPAVAMDKSMQGSGNDKSNIRSTTNSSNIRRASVATASTASSASASHPSLLSRSNSSVLPTSTSAGALHQRPKDLAAIQVLPNTSEWILAKIISFDKSSKIYTLSDEDVESDKVYHIPASRVVVLNKNSNYTRGDSVYAVYPDTTSFYLATVSSCKNNFVMVHFRDDGDEHGVTHEKAVPIWLVMRVPAKG